VMSRFNMAWEFIYYLSVIKNNQNYVYENYQLV